MLGNLSVQARKLWYCHEPPRGLHPSLANPWLADHATAKGMDLSLAIREFRKMQGGHERRLQRSSRLREDLRFDREGVDLLQAIAVNSEFTRGNVKAIYGRSPEQVIYPMVRFRGKGSLRTGLDRTGPSILALARLEHLKNIDSLIRGFTRFLKPCPTARLHLVGEGPARSELEALASALAPAGTVLFHGFLEEEQLERVFSVCDIFALLPLDEPFGMVFPEAASRGLLMVGPDHGGPMEIMEGGRLGWTVEALDPEALAEALAQIWALSDAEVDRKRARADLACRRRYSPEVIGPQLSAFVDGK